MEFYYVALDHLALNITRRCNQRCIFCFEGDRKGWDELSIDKIVSFVEDVVKKKGVKSLIFMGAEALLRKDICEIVRLCKEAGIKYISAFTNGQVFARDGFLEELVKAGLNGISLSFHYADADSFSYFTGTDKRFFERFLNALQKIDEFNKRNGLRFNVSTETLLFAGNENKLVNIVDLIQKTLKHSLRCIGFKRIQRTVVRDRNVYLLDNLRSRRSEIKKIAEIINYPVYFTRIPLCIIPDMEHLSTDLQYILKNSQVLANFADKSRITVMHDLLKNFMDNPFKDVCIKCGLLGLCPMVSSSYENKAFFPYESQRPIPSRRDVKRIIQKIATGEDEAEEIYKNYLEMNSKLKQIYYNKK